MTYERKTGGAGAGGVSDHGALTGLADDDHPYLLESAVSAFGLTMLDDATAAAVRATIDAAQNGTYVPLALADAAGDLFYATADNTWARLPKGTALQRLRMNAGATAPEWASAALPLLHVRDEQASGANAGTFTSGAWQVRPLQTIVTNELGVTLASNVITGLPAGTYEVEASAPAHLTEFHKARLYDVTGSAVLVTGTNARTSSAASAISMSVVRGRFTLSATSDVRLEHRCLTTRATDGFGVAMSFGVVEVYAEVLIRRIS